MSTRHRSRAAYAGIALLLGSVLTGCGTTTPTTPSKQLCIASDFPTSTKDSGLGKSAENGVALAIDQAKLHGGYSLQLQRFDDTVNNVGSASQGAANVTTMANTPCVLAMVGPLDNDVANAEIRIAANSGLPMISPATTNPGLSQEQFAQLYDVDFAALHPTGKPEVYFTLPVTDDVQGKVDAQLALAAGAKRVYVVDDAETYGRALAGFFAQGFQAAGGAILGRASTAGTNISQFSTLVSQMKASNADLVFYGGLAATGGPLRAAMSAGGMASVPMAGTDGIAGDASFIQAAGATAAEGTLGTRPVPDIAALSSSTARTFVSDYKAKFNGDPTGYSANAFDAANLEIAAINAAIDAGQLPTRTNVLDKIAHMSYLGVTGTISFDASGDNVGTRMLSVDKVENGVWAYVKTVAAP
jgi:branched-chain amino acid transport system substrate-binding protein